MRLPWRKERAKTESRYGMDWLVQQLSFAGHQYGIYGNNTLGYTTTYGSNKAEPIGADFEGLVRGALQSNSIVSAVELVRLRVFSEARFQFQVLRGGRPGDLFGTPELAILEKPWPGGTTGDLLARMILDADFGGTSYTARVGNELMRLRPDWVEVVLAARVLPMGPGGEEVVVGWTTLGHYYYDGGRVAGKTPALFLPGEVAVFAPYPDPLATYRGMSWLGPVVEEIRADGAATKHKLKFFENAATPNLSVSLPAGPTPMTPEQFNAFVDAMDGAHKGVENAYKTLYTANGADVKVVGADMSQIDFKSTQGAGETRIAAAGRVPAVLVGISEGLAGSSLNSGNYASAKRSFADGEMRSLWRNAAASLEVLLNLPANTRLWYDDRDVAFLREDQKDAAEIQQIQALSIRQLTDAGFLPDSIIAAIDSEDHTLLQHSGLFSVQLQAPVTGQPAPEQEPPS